MPSVRRCLMAWYSGDSQPGIGSLLGHRQRQRRAGETLDVALRREVQEETGLEMGAITGYLGSFDYASATGKKSRQFNFAIDVAATEPARLQEHDAYLWTAPDADPPVAGAVKNLLANYAQVIGG